MFFMTLFFLIVSDRANAASRIISMNPVGTEILFELGLGNRIIGVTQFCDWPKEALSKPKLSDLRDLNLELLVSLRPDLLVLSDMQTELRGRIQEMGIATVLVSQQSVQHVYSSILNVARAAGVPTRGEQKVSSLKKRVHYLQKLVEKKQRPTVLVSIGRDLSQVRFVNSFFAGPDTAYNELLEIAGGRNAITAKNSRVLAYPQISLEGVIRMNPDVILDLVAGHGYGAPDHGQNVREQWMTAQGVSAVKNHRVYVIADSVVLRPGPRFPQIIEHVIRVLHPEVKVSP